MIRCNITLEDSTSLPNPIEVYFVTPQCIPYPYLFLLGVGISNIHDRSLPCLDTSTNIKSSGVKLADLIWAENIDP